VTTIRRDLLIDGYALAVLLVSIFGWTYLVINDLGLLVIGFWFETGLDWLGTFYSSTLGRVFYGPITSFMPGVYFTGFFVSMLILQRRSGLRRSFLKSVWIASILVIAFEIIIWRYYPGFMGVYVTNAQIGSPLASFTNWDFLAVGVTAFILSSLMLGLARKGFTIDAWRGKRSPPKASA